MKNPFSYLYYTGLLVLIVTLTFTTFFILKFSSILPSLLSQQGKKEYYKETEIIPKSTSETKESETLVIKPTVKKIQSPSTPSQSTQTTGDSTKTGEKTQLPVVPKPSQTNNDSINKGDSTSQIP
jgi:hypothetical protein